MSAPQRLPTDGNRKGDFSTESHVYQKRRARTLSLVSAKAAPLLSQSLIWERASLFCFVLGFFPVKLLEALMR